MFKFVYIMIAVFCMYLGMVADVNLFGTYHGFISATVAMIFVIAKPDKWLKWSETNDTEDV